MSNLTNAPKAKNWMRGDIVRCVNSAALNLASFVVGEHYRVVGRGKGSVWISISETSPRPKIINHKTADHCFEFVRSRELGMLNGEPLYPINWKFGDVVVDTDNKEYSVTKVSTNPDRVRLTPLAGGDYMEIALNALGDHFVFVRRPETTATIEGWRAGNEVIWISEKPEGFFRKPGFVRYVDRDVLIIAFEFTDTIHPEFVVPMDAANKWLKRVCIGDASVETAPDKKISMSNFAGKFDAVAYAQALSNLGKSLKTCAIKFDLHTPFSGVSDEPTPKPYPEFIGAPGYQRLADVLQAAHDQAAFGEANERNNVDGDLPFEKQRMQQISQLLDKPDGMAYEVCKKVIGGLDLPNLEARRAEMLGAINYLAGIVIYMEDAINAKTNPPRD